MTSKRLKQLLREYPYLLDDAFVMSASEADRIVRQHGFVSFPEMIQSAKLRFGLPDEAWADFDAVIARRSRRQLLRAKYPNMAKLRLSPARVAIASFIIGLLIFFTLIPVGRTLAKAIIEYCINFVENGFIIDNDPAQTPDTQLNSTFIPESELKEAPSCDAACVFESGFNSIEEIVSQTGMRPCVIKGKGFSVAQISFSDYDALSPGWKELYTQYMYEGEVNATLMQDWHAADMVIEEEKVYELQNAVMGTYKLYYTIDEKDNTFTGFVILPDSVLRIWIKDGMDVDMVLKSIDIY